MNSIADLRGSIARVVLTDVAKNNLQGKSIEVKFEKESGADDVITVNKDNKSKARDNVTGVIRKIKIYNHTYGLPDKVDGTGARSSLNVWRVRIENAKVKESALGIKYLNGVKYSVDFKGNDSWTSYTAVEEMKTAGSLN